MAVALFAMLLTLRASSLLRQIRSLLSTIPLIQSCFKCWQAKESVKQLDIISYRGARGPR